MGIVDYMCFSRLCLDFWKTEKAEYTNCTTDNMHLKDLAEPCRLFGEELKFNKALGIKDKKLSKYENNDLDEMSLKANAPLEVFWKELNIHKKLDISTMKSINSLF